MYILSLLRGVLCGFLGKMLFPFTTDSAPEGEDGGLQQQSK